MARTRRWNLLLHHVWRYLLYDTLFLLFLQAGQNADSNKFINIGVVLRLHMKSCSSATASQSILCAYV